MPVRNDSITCPKCAGTRGYVETCDTCNHTGYVRSFINSFGDTISVCNDCNGEGCNVRQGVGRSIKWHQTPGYAKGGFASRNIVPMPYGKMLPDLTDCNYINEPEWDSYLGPILCPSCNSNNVAGLSSEYNPRIVEENRTPSGRWFCISCQESWCYEREI